MIYLDKGLDKIAVNFVDIKALCTKCRATFSLRSKLYNHLTSSCLEMSLSIFPIQTVLFIFIINSKTVHQSFGSGHAFKG